MELWRGPIRDFNRDSQSRVLAPAMLQSFYTYHGHQPGESEVRSWENSLAALSEATGELNKCDIGVVVEYHLPFSNKRIDAVFLGRSQEQASQAVVVELKQWSQVAIEDDFALNLLVDGSEHAHPSQQALDYAGTLEDVHSAFVTGDLHARACSYCHNMISRKAQALLSPQFNQLLQQSPLFKKGEETLLEAYLGNHIGHGSGVALMKEYVTGKFRPSKKLIDTVEATIKNQVEWHLLDRQREAYNAVFAQVRRLQQKKGRSAVLIRGGPGTGKSVIAIQLLADCLRAGLSAAHSTGGKAFTMTLRSKFKGAEDLFIWNMNTRKEAPQSIDLLLVDEAHRVRKTSDMQYTPAKERNQRSQMQELLDCSKVTVFFLDENQYVRPDEVGCSQLVRDTTKELGVPLREYDLDTQFRCGGCTEYTSWVDWMLGFTGVKPQPWGQMYQLKVVDSPEALDQMMLIAKKDGERARLAAGFCWPWSKSVQGEPLTDDVLVGSWARPWNQKPIENKNYKPQNHPYTLWAETPVGETQVGCIYSAQGFEFDRMGIIWGNDLVWRGTEWIAQKEHSYDRPVKSKNSDTLRLVRNAYRVLLTRGIKQTYLLCLDAETRDHIINELNGMQTTPIDVHP